MFSTTPAMLTKKQETQCPLNHQPITQLLTNETNTSTEHKQSIQCSNLNVLICFLPACIQRQHIIHHTITSSAATTQILLNMAKFDLFPRELNLKLTAHISVAHL